MDTEDALKLVRQYKEVIQDAYHPTAVYLYGSYSRGEQRSTSDIDVAVIIPEMKGSWFDNVPPLWTAGRKVSDLIEPVLMEECHPSPLYETVLKTGILV